MDCKQIKEELVFLFADNEMEAVPTKWLDNNSDMLRKLVEAYTANHGFPPHPGVLIEEAKRVGKRQKL